MQNDITFHSTWGTKLSWILTSPSENFSETPLMILCHWFSSNKWRTTYLDIEKHMLDIGVATFRFDFFGHGESWWDLGDITLTEAVDDTLQAFKLMKEMWFEKIGLFWSSFGWCTALNVASQLNEQLYCLVCKCPPSDYAQQKERKLWKEWMKRWQEEWTNIYEMSRWRVAHLKYAYYEDMKNNNVHEKAHKITIPTLIVHGTADQTVLPRHSEKTAELIPDCELQLVEWANHRFDYPWERLLINWFFKKFINKHLATEQITLVDKNDNEIWRLPKSSFFASEHIHRWVHMILKDWEKILLQKRSKTKKLYPDTWTFGVSWTVTYWKSCEEVMHCENLEEIGVDYDVTYLFKFFEEDEFDRSRTYVYEADYAWEEFIITEDDISHVERFETDDLKKLLVDSPNSFTPDALRGLKQYLEI